MVGLLFEILLEVMFKVVGGGGGGGGEAKGAQSTPLRIGFNLRKVGSFLVGFGLWF